MKIFVTTGTQLPFSRLLNLCNKLLAEVYPSATVIYQSGDVTFSPSVGTNIPFIKDQKEFLSIVKSADLIISHAGMGTVITCLTMQKKVIVFPRMYKLKEHRNDHQEHTADWLNRQFNLPVARNDKELLDLILECETNTFSDKKLLDFGKNLENYIYE